MLLDVEIFLFFVLFNNNWGYVAHKKYVRTITGGETTLSSQFQINEEDYG
jgi:hypothetical protein